MRAAEKALILKHLETGPVGLVPEGIAGIFYGADRFNERVFGSKHKGYAKLALRCGAGTQVFPCEVQTIVFEVQLFPSKVQGFPFEVQVFPSKVQVFYFEVQGFCFKVQLFPSTMQVFHLKVHLKVQVYAEGTSKILPIRYSL